MRYFIFVLLASACASDPAGESLSTKNDDVNPGITVVFESDGDSPYTLSRDQTFEERLRGIPEVDTLSAPRDTVHFPLDEAIQLVYGNIPSQLERQTLLVRTGDTVHIDIKDGETDIYKLSRNKKEEVLWSESRLLPDNSLFKEMEALRSVFITEQPAGEMVFLMPNTKRKTEWNDRLPDYVEVIDRYYGQLLDSLSLMEGAEKALYMDVLQWKHFFELSSLNDVVNNANLSRRLNSSEYINLDYFNSRYLNLVIAFYFHRNYKFNNDKLLTDAYEEGFTTYPKDMRQSFKAQTISSMIVKKYDREMILAYVDSYKKEFGTVTPLETILEEIEYGTVADHDLILQDLFGKEVKWEALRKQWEGKIIYVDFWASWCAPCLRAMPFSKELEKQLLNEDVVFVYLALNDKEKAWRDMSKKYQIVENNYLIINSRSSKFITQTNLDVIPRYMIYDRNGKLIHQHAPAPDKKEALGVLTSYLKNQ